jgi:dipeptidyl-peptidase-4
MANALIAANKQFDTYFYPNRNHGIYGDNARLHLYQKMTDFIMEKLYKPIPASRLKRPAATDLRKMAPGKRLIKSKN